MYTFVCMMLLGMIIGIIGAIRKSWGPIEGPIGGIFVGGVASLFLILGLSKIPQTDWVLSEENVILNIQTQHGEDRLFERSKSFVFFSETATGLHEWQMSQNEVEVNIVTPPFELGAPGTYRCYRLVNTNSLWDNWTLRDEVKFVVHLPGQVVYSTLE